MVSLWQLLLPNFDATAAWLIISLLGIFLLFLSRLVTALPRVQSWIQTVGVLSLVGGVLLWMFNSFIKDVYLIEEFRWIGVGLIVIVAAGFAIFYDGGSGGKKKR